MYFSKREFNLISPPSPSLPTGYKFNTPEAEAPLDIAAGFCSSVAQPKNRVKCVRAQQTPTRSPSLRFTYPPPTVE